MRKYRLVIILIALNLTPLLPDSSFIGIIIKIIAIVAIVSIFSNHFFAHIQPTLRYTLGFLLLCIYYALCGSLIFYIFELNTTVLIVLSLISSCLILLPRHLFAVFDKSTIVQRSSSKFLSQSSVVLVFVAIAIIVLTILTRHQIYVSTVSLWQHLPRYIYTLFFILSLFLILAIQKKSAHTISYFLYGFIALATAAILFPLGYGFDPFIHQATEQLLLQTGTISPKPFYYIGYYVINNWLHYFTSIPIATIDIFSVPLLASSSIPIVVYATTKIWFSKTAHFAPLVLLLLPYATLIQSTPQSLAFTWMILVLFLAILVQQKILSKVTLSFLTLATITFHPLVGLPLAIFTLAVIIGMHNTSKKISVKKIAQYILPFIAMAILPLAFLLLGVVIPIFKPLVINNLGNDALRNIPELFYYYIRLDDFLYSYNNIIFIVVTLIGFLVALKAKSAQWPYVLKNYIIFALASFASFLILHHFFAFPFLHESEQSIFANRLLIMSVYFILPLLVIGWLKIIERVKELPASLVRSFWIIVAMLMTITWYLSYPRFDTRSQHTGHSASQYDYETVDWIHQASEGETYIVLANQTLSGVAIKKYGFFQYHNELFYYPVPTSGPLYQRYLSIVNLTVDANAAISGLLKETGVDSVYLVIHDYWSDAANIRDSIEKVTAPIHILGENIITIYQFQ